MKCKSIIQMNVGDKLKLDSNNVAEKTDGGWVYTNRIMGVKSFYSVATTSIMGISLLGDDGNFIKFECEGEG